MLIPLPLLIEVSQETHWESLNGGLANRGLKVLVHNCLRLPTIVVILRRKFPCRKRPKRATEVHNCRLEDCASNCLEIGLKPPFESPHFLGCTRRGRTLRKGLFLPSKHLVSAFYNTPPSTNPSKNPCPY